eukprot:CAMPEP_0197879582 /NCGR_PEP_ID=MMETSP1439-20131203/7640_1 /TAXON_ID=66791 /ORGANISM="Gonyaulax spinifera, Strain CCMP409" /LENGTH=72 /DNA_ID=CAMNT_0043499099 /DNA_START=84 /DNA_END=302 /DNA_ORIENTATION=+
MATTIDKKTMAQMDAMILACMQEDGGAIPTRTAVSEEYARKRQDELKAMGITGPFTKASQSLKVLEEIESKV